MLHKSLILISVIVISMSSLMGQPCELPVVSNYSNPSSSSMTIHWIDFSNDDARYEIELGEAGFTRTLSPTASNIQGTSYDYTGLNHATHYEFYMRSVCDQALSDWNGPYFFNTNIINGEACQISLPIDDNNCPTVNEYLIEITDWGGLLLGTDVFVEHIDVVVNHSWPPDLKMELVTPEGNAIYLIKNEGISIPNFGNPDNTDCTETLRFSDLACQSFSDQALIGNYLAEEKISNLESPNGNANGIWKLNICDRASGDIGILNAVNISLQTTLCQLAPNIHLSDVDGSYVTVAWYSHANCSDVKMSYGLAGFPPNQATIDFASCDKNEFTINGLQANTDYEIQFETICNDNGRATACPIFFTTTCANSTLSTDFDDLDICIDNCNMRCNVPDSTWHNLTDNIIDWILYTGSTRSQFTGPERDVSGFGNYIYLESQPEACGLSYSSVFESNCLDIINTQAGCGISFYYYMYGNDVDSLSLEISDDEGEHWDILWQQRGNQGQVWHYTQVDLSPYEKTSSRLRFIANSTGGNLGDIAIDLIKLFGPQINNDLFDFYQDFDQDGYGDPSEQIIICQEEIPMGYVSNALDCDDRDDDISPLAQEILCNGIDENCNGNQDDVSAQIQLSIQEEVNATCYGIDNGILEVLAFGGSGAYSYEWDNGRTGPRQEQLAAGTHTCTITDLLGCQLIAEYLFVDVEENINYAVSGIVNPSCPGVSDGKIAIIADGGVAPYSYKWNSGAEGLFIEDLNAGTYVVTITDDNGCNIVSDSILLTANKTIFPGIQLQRDVSCFNGTDGSLLANVQGGQAPYEFRWNTGDSTTIISGLSAGNYALTVTDALGCSGFLSDIQLNQADSLEIIIDGVEHIRCFESRDGIIEISALGGNPPYAYFWSDNVFSADRFNMPSGSYDLTVTDSKSCRAELSNIVIDGPDQINIQIDSLSNVNCTASSNGFISLELSGGLGPYQYNWSNGSKESFIKDLSSGFYSVTVVDQFDCKLIRNNLEIKELSAPLMLNHQMLGTNLCHDDSLASIEIEVANGIAPYDFNWNVGQKLIKDQPLDTLSNLPGGFYQITVTDHEGCLGTKEIEVFSPAEILYDITKSGSNCADDNNGFIELDINGGSPGYMISWDSGLSGANIFDLPDGEYQGSILDQNSCERIISEIVITSPEPLFLQTEIQGIWGALDNGEIRLILDGGTPPYQYIWADPLGNLTDSIATQLFAGWYNLTILDNNMCAIDTSLFVDGSTATTNPITSEISIYPNPATDRFYIETDVSWDKIEFFDIHGKLIDHLFEQLGPNRFESSYTGISFIAIHQNNQAIIWKKMLFID